MKLINLGPILIAVAVVGVAIIALDNGTRVKPAPQPAASNRIDEPVISKAERDFVVDCTQRRMAFLHEGASTAVHECGQEWNARALALFNATRK
jgi:hypothetical protein